MVKPEFTNIKRIFWAARYSKNGLKYAFLHEPAFQQEFILTLIAIPLGLYFGDSVVERALLLGSVFFILVTELLNSGIEAIIDRFGEANHFLSARAKDLGSAAVFMAIINFVFVWVLVLLT